jgi:LytS/YehU family sensor histidine kinase
MRYVLYQANEEKVELNKELDFIRNYVELQKIRYHNRYDIRFEVEGNPEGKKVSPLLFIDFTENAFKHGIDKRFTDGFVHVKFIIHQEEVIFQCRNSIGNNEQEGIIQQNAGIGLANVKKRLSILYQQQHTLNISDEGEIFHVELKLELI